MNNTYSGGCACGTVRYEIADQPIFESHCQCLDCQRRSGTGHGSYLTFPQRKKARITGNATEWSVKGDSGNEKIHAFCPTCGTPVYLTFAAMPDLLTVHATSLDAPNLFKPVAVTYASRAQNWDSLDASLAIFDQMPQ